MSRYFGLRRVQGQLPRATSRSVLSHGPADELRRHVRQPEDRREELRPLRQALQAKSGLQAGRLPRRIRRLMSPPLVANCISGYPAMSGDTVTGDGSGQSATLTSWCHGPRR